MAELVGQGIRHAGFDDRARILVITSLEAGTNIVTIKTCSSRSASTNITSLLPM